MSEEEINYWLEVFSSNKYTFMSKDGSVIPIYKAFEQLKEYKSVLDEIREYCKNKIGIINETYLSKEVIWNEDFLLDMQSRKIAYEEILDKVKE